MKHCKVCEKEISAKATYCSNKCQQKNTKNTKVQQWLSNEITGMKRGARLIHSVREYLLERADHKCECCGWGEINPVTGRSPLEINHIDGNAGNNRPENLQVICPNCHSLTPTWKALNKGNGNKERLRYSKL